MKYIIIDMPVSGPKRFDYNKDGGILKMTNFRRSLSLFNGLENQTIKITMDNRKGEWSSLMTSQDRYLKGRTLEIYEDGELQGTLKISDFPKPANPLQFDIKGDTFTFLEQPVSPLISIDLFPNVPPENEGKPGNIFGGTVDDADWTDTGMMPAYLVDTGKYLAAWHHCWNISACRKGDGTEILFTYDNNADGYCYIEPVGGCTDTVIYFNGSGMIDSGNLIENPGSMLLKIVEVFGSGVGIEISGIDSLISRYTERFRNTLILIQEHTWKKLLSEYSLNFDTFWSTTIDGRLQANMLNFESIEVVARFTPSMFSKYEHHLDIAFLEDTCKKMFRYHFKDKEYRYTPAVTLPTLWQGNSTGEIELKWQKDAISAHDVAVENLYRRKAEIEWVSFCVPKKHMPPEDILGKCIEAMYPHSLHPGQYRAYLVLAIEVNTPYEYSLKLIDIEKWKGALITLLEDNDPAVAVLANDDDLDCLILM